MFTLDIDLKNKACGELGLTIKDDEIEFRCSDSGFITLTREEFLEIEQEVDQYYEDKMVFEAVQEEKEDKEDEEGQEEIESEYLSNLL